MLLQYEIGIDDRQMRRVLRGVEREVAASNRRAARGGGAGGGGPMGPMFGPGRKEFEAQQKARMRHERDLARAGAALDRQRATALMQLNRAAEREKMRGERAAATEARRLDRDRASAARALDRQRAAGLMAQHRQREAAERRSQAMRERTGNSLARGAARTVTGGVGTVARVGGAALTVAGGFLAADAMRTRMSEGAQASVIANKAGDPAMKSRLLQEAQDVKGFTGAEVLGGLGAFQTKTGNLEMGRKLMPMMAKVGIADDANLEDLAATAGQAFNVLKNEITDPVELLRELEQLLPVLSQQGRMGAVEISDLATEFSKLGAATRGFEGGGAGLLRSMGAFAQIAMDKGGASTSSDAATAAARLSGDIVTNRKKFAALGVGVQSKTDKTKLRAPEEIMLDVLEKTGGDITKTSGLFGMESRKIFGGIAATFSEAEAQKKGSGRGAAQAYFASFAGAKPDMVGIEAQAASRLEDDDKKFLEAKKVFNNAIAQELLPVVTRSVGEFSRAVPAVAKLASAAASFAGWFMDNPIKGVGSVVLAAVAKDVAGAGISGLLKKAFGGRGGGVPVGGAGGAAGSAKGALAGTAAVVGVAAAVDQGMDLTKASGGLQGVWAGIKGAFSGKGYAGGVSEFFDEKARREFNDPMSAENMERRAQGAGGAGAATDVGSAKLEGAADKLASAVASLERAADRMGKDGVAPSRTTPIVAR